MDFFCLRGTLDGQKIGMFDIDAYNAIWAPGHTVTVRVSPNLFLAPNATSPFPSSIRLDVISVNHISKRSSDLDVQGGFVDSDNAFYKPESGDQLQCIRRHKRQPCTIRRLGRSSQCGPCSFGCERIHATNSASNNAPDDLMHFTLLQTPVATLNTMSEQCLHPDLVGSWARKQLLSHVTNSIVLRRDAAIFVSIHTMNLGTLQHLFTLFLPLVSRKWTATTWLYKLLGIVYPMSISNNDIMLRAWVCAVLAADLPAWTSAALPFYPTRSTNSSFRSAQRRPTLTLDGNTENTRNPSKSQDAGGRDDRLHDCVSHFHLFPRFALLL